MKRSRLTNIARLLAVAAAVMLVVWHVVPVYEEAGWAAAGIAGSTEWRSKFGWTVWQDLFDLIRELARGAGSVGNAWQAGVFASCFVSGVAVVVALAAAVWFEVPQRLRIVLACVAGLAFLGGPVLLVVRWSADPPNTDSEVFFPTFWLWPTALTACFIASVMWAAGAKKNTAAGQ